MKTEILPLSAFPLLTESIKRAVGLSLWNLYRISTPQKEVCFLLQTGGKQYLLSEDGNVIREVGEAENVNRNEKIMFEGYAISPDVLQNALCV